MRTEDGAVSFVYCCQASYTSTQKLYLCNLLHKKRRPSPHICSLYELDFKQRFTSTKCCPYLLICLPVWQFANRLSDFKEHLTLAMGGIVPRYITHFATPEHNDNCTHCRI
jgi:hypothetical protein